MRLCGMFSTPVRLPSTPLGFRVSNPYDRIKIGARKNTGCISIKTDFLKEETEEFPLSINGVRKWVRAEFGMSISKSSVCAVRDKCGASELKVGAGKTVPKLKSKKELAVLAAFRHFGVLE